MTLEIIRDRSNRSAEAEVFKPNTEADLINLLKQFNQAQTPVTIAAGRTALTGSCVPASGVVIDVMGLPSEINSALARFGPALEIEALDALLAEEGKVYLPTPGYKKCSLGGTVATNASGPRTFSFGSTRDHVLFLRVVLMDGEVLEINRGEHVSAGENFVVSSLEGISYTIPCPKYDWPEIKNATGLYAKKPLDLIDLFIGSEGLLGVITQIGIKTYAFKQTIKTEAYFFEDESQALECVSKMQKYGFDRDKMSGFISIEFMDQGALKLSDFTEYQHYAGAIELEYFAEDEATIKFWNDLVSLYNIGAVLEGENVPRFRYSIPLNLSERLREYQTVKVASDFSVPVKNFPAMYAAYKKAMTEFDKAKVTEDVTTAIWGHIGDCHLHLNFIPQSTDQEVLAQKLYLELAQKCVELGGVLSAEHGLGKKRFIDERPLLEVQNPAMIAEIQQVKLALDPHFLLNGGNMVPKPSGKGRKEI